MPNDYFILGCLGLQLKQKQLKRQAQAPQQEEAYQPERSSGRENRDSSRSEGLRVNSSSRPPLSIPPNRPLAELFSSQYQDSDDEKIIIKSVADSPILIEASPLDASEDKNRFDFSGKITPSKFEDDYRPLSSFNNTLSSARYSESDQKSSKVRTIDEKPPRTINMFSPEVSQRLQDVKAKHGGVNRKQEFDNKTAVHDKESIKKRLAELKKKYGVTPTSNKNDDSLAEFSEDQKPAEPVNQKIYLDSLQENLQKKLQNIKKEEQEEKYVTPTKPSSGATTQKDVISLTDYKAKLKEELEAKRRKKMEEYTELSGGKKVKSALADRVNNLEKTLYQEKEAEKKPNRVNEFDRGLDEQANLYMERGSQSNKKKARTRMDEFD